MLRSLFSGVSGMKNNQIKMDVIGNNIANVNTTAFKAGRVRFQDILSQTVKNAVSPSIEGRGGINPMQVGLGTQVAGVDTITNNGSLQPTGRPLDCAVDGEGYFVLSDGELLEGSKVLYSRDGAFNFDSANNIVSSNGYRVMGYRPTRATMMLNYKADLSKTGGLNWSNVTMDSVLKLPSALRITGPKGTYSLGLSAVKTADTDLDTSTLSLSPNSNITINNTKVDLTNVIGLTAPMSIDDVVTALQSDIDAVMAGKYTVGKDGNKLTVTSTAIGSSAVVDLASSDPDDCANILGFTPGAVNGADEMTGSMAAKKTADADIGNLVDLDQSTTIKIEGQPVDLANLRALGAGYDAQGNIDTVVARLQEDIDSIRALNGKYVVGKDGDRITITSKATGSTSAVDLSGSDALTAASLGFTNLDPVTGSDGLTIGSIIDDINANTAATGVKASLKNGALVFESSFAIDDRANPNNRIVVAGSGDFDGLNDIGEVGVSDAITDEESFKDAIDAKDLRSLSIPEEHPLKSGVKINNYSIEADGTIRGVYDDGSVLALGKIALAKFINPAGLTKLGGNNYGTSANSGNAEIGTAGSNSTGDIQQSQLEMSNVDLASEFTEMIITSRAFQANSRTITTSDEMLQELLNLKR